MPVNLFAGCVIGVLVVFLEISLAALIFSGELSEFFGAGIGILLLGTLISLLVAVCFSGFKISVSLPQDVPAAIIAVLAATLVAQPDIGNPAEAFATVVFVMVCSTLLTGVMLWCVGHFSLGKVVRFLPYPVIGGFMAGTGWLLFVGGIGVLNPGGINAGLFNAESMVQWLPALLLGSVMLLATRRYSHPLVMPAVVLFALFTFFLSLILINGSFSAAIEFAMSRGWLLGRMPEAEFWRPVPLSLLGEVNWSAILGNTLVMVSVFLISTVSLLLNCSGLEIITRSDVDLNRELKIVGLANIASAGVGSSANYHMLSLSTLNYRLGATTRVAGATVAVVVALTIVFGAGVLANTPKLVLAGFLIYLGLGFLTEWLYDGWFKLPGSDYFLVWLILSTIALMGLLQGVILGVIVAAALFVFAYTKTSLVRHTFTRNKYQSHIMRSPEIEKRLEEKGEGFLVVELQGFVFFGMAHQLLDKIKYRIKDTAQSRLRYLLLDFRLVTGFDSSASYSFSRLLQVASESGITVGLSNISPEVQRILNQHENVMSYRVPVFDDLDEGVAWFDSKDLLIDETHTEQQSLIAYLRQSLPESSESEGAVEVRVTKFMQHLEMKAGAVLLHEGDAVDYVYFIESGEVSIQTVRPGKKAKVLRIQSAGTVFGEIGIYSSDTATATVVVSKDAALYRMSKSDLDRLDREDPQLSIVVHRLIAKTLGRKLRQVNSSLVALHE